MKWICETCNHEWDGDYQETECPKCKSICINKD